MAVKTIQTTPFLDQNPGTSGLRKTVKVFSQPHYLENYVQAIFNAVDGFKNQTIVIGGDGRYFNTSAIQTIIKMAIAQGVGRILVGQNGILSTPACSCVIRKHQIFAGFVLSASHNPGGIDGDFGLKLNVANGGPASETITKRIFEQACILKSYQIADIPDIAIDKIGKIQCEQTCIEIIDPVADYAEQMAKLFDFAAIADLFSKGFTIRFDAMHAVCGPYAKKILHEQLGAPIDSIINADPLPDFGGRHPDPNPVDEADLVAFMNSLDATDIAVATDGDGDRNLILGKKMVVSPSDSLAILAANARLIPAYQAGLQGVARSMPTSSAVDHVAKALGIAHYETPTGWKFFGNLLDDNRITLCGEESFGTSSNHIREKDGIWAILFWLNLIAKTGKRVDEIVQDHWQKFGRNYYARHDYINVDANRANDCMNHLRDQLASLAGQKYGDLTIDHADEFSYKDPVDGSVSNKQGIRIFFTNGSRIIFRLSGTGTIGATIRVYFDHYERKNVRMQSVSVLQHFVDIAEAVAQLKFFTQLEAPSMVS